jgi:membrane protein required for colicin V production
MPVTLLDGILLGITLVSAVLAMIRGFSREVLSVASWAAAAIAALFFYKQATPLVQPYVDSELVAQAAAAGGIFLITLILVSLITMKIADFIIDSRVGALDRTLGFVFGAARGILLVVVAISFFNWLVDSNQPGWIAEAKSKPLLDSLSGRLMAMLPEDAAGTVMKKLRPAGEETPEAAPAGETPAAEAPAEGEETPPVPETKPAAGNNG